MTLLAASIALVLMAHSVPGHAAESSDPGSSVLLDQLCRAPVGDTGPSAIGFPGARFSGPVVLVGSHGEVCIDLRPDPPLRSVGDPRTTPEDREAFIRVRLAGVSMAEGAPGTDPAFLGLNVAGRILYCVTRRREARGLLVDCAINGVPLAERLRSYAVGPGPLADVVESAVDNVCKPFVAFSETSKEPAMQRAAAHGFERVSRERSLSGVGEDLAYVRAAGGTVTISLDPEVGDPTCTVTVEADPAAFDSYLQGLSDKGWTSAGPPVMERETRNEWLWSPDGMFTVVAGRYAGPLGTAPAWRVLALVVESGRRPIPPPCSPERRVDCRLVN